MEKIKGKVIMIKNNKGGVGKTTDTGFLGETAALNNKKVLIITTDSQNDILNYMLSEKQPKKDNLSVSELNNSFPGLKAEVQKRGTGDFYKLMDNLSFLPLENNSFGSEFLKRIPFFLEEVRREYDYILIDSVPVLKTDDIFSDYCDYIIVPTHATAVSIQHVLEFAENISEDKLIGLVINQFNKTKTQKSYLELLESHENINVLGVIPQLSAIERILNNRKSIWDYQNKDILGIQTTLFNIFNVLESLEAPEIIEEKYKEKIKKYLPIEEQNIFESELSKRNDVEQSVFIRFVYNNMIREKKLCEIEKQKINFIRNHLDEIKLKGFEEKMENTSNKKEKSVFINLTYGRLRQRNFD